MLESFGAGNVPHDIVSALKEATSRNVLIVNVTQCLEGMVDDSIYAAGEVRHRVSLIGRVLCTYDRYTTLTNFLAIQYERKLNCPTYRLNKIQHAIVISKLYNNSYFDKHIKNFTTYYNAALYYVNDKSTIIIYYLMYQQLLKAGVVPGADMTSEAALAKMAYVLSDPSLTTYDMKKEVSL